MTRILLHIGGEKTGTTTLQAFLARNADLLLERYGVFYPTSGPLHLDSGHFPCVSAFIEPHRCDFVSPRNRLRPEDVVAALAELSRARHPELIILSAEHFSSRLRRPEIRRLAEGLSAFETEILFYVRRQDDLAVSSFSTALRSGARGWLDPRRISGDNRYFNHLMVADDWADGFGPAHLRLRSFDALQHGVEADFLAAIGVDPADGFEPVAWRRNRLTLQEATLLHVVNQHAANWADVTADDDIESYYEAQRLRERVLRLVAQEANEETSLSVILGREARAAIMSTFAESNRRLAAKYDARIPDRPDDLQPLAAEGSELDLDDLLDLLARLLVRVGNEAVELEQRISAMEARTVRGRLSAAKSVLAQCVHRMELPLRRMAGTGDEIAAMPPRLSRDRGGPYPGT